jgi:hypothetical protein
MRKFLKASGGILTVATLMLFPLRSADARESMASMPKIEPKKTYLVPSDDAGDDLSSARGFGDQEPMVRMMNLMMVEGSGFEGMDMGAMKMDGKKPTPEAAPAGGMAGMAGMNMPGMKMAGSEPEAPPPHGAAPNAAARAKPADGTGFDVQPVVVPTKPVVGANMVEFTVSDAKSHAPSTKLKLKAQVYMTSMNMGVEEPQVKEISPGRYRVKAIFSMAGPWALKIILPQGGEKIIDFKANSQK